MRQVRRLLEAPEVDRAIARLEAAIVAAEPDPANLCLVGIRRGGVPLAERLAERIRASTGHRPPLGSLDITLYRDDLGAHAVPKVGPTRIDFPITDRTVVLVDDVLYTGRTVRAALQELSDFGRSRRVYLAVLVERPGRELPIQADFVGEGVAATPAQRVEVRLREQHGGADEVVLLE
ncbi:MAG TPA: bifunctional pyr operon transcriptional regulator/uracil phosphoribosyltransferase PyrR [Vulgatibacter sp.]|nr:bifunctional pyr operon transcriptional regulator/uracil phosphoribosyltransferase PyrR [Vulgatibacter sp.]